MQLLPVRLHLRFNPVVNPVRVPPFHRIDRNSIEQHGEMQVVAAGQSRLTRAADLLLSLSPDHPL